MAMMSLLSKTKGYFAVICVLMCGFLITFSWRLLYSTSDANIVISPSRRGIRKLENTASKTFVRGSTRDKDKGEANVKKRFMDEEVSSLVAKIHELGLTEKQVKEKLVSWQQQRLIQRNSSAIPSSRFQSPKSRELIFKKLKNGQNNKTMSFHTIVDEEMQNKGENNSETKKINPPSRENMENEQRRVSFPPHAHGRPTFSDMSKNIANRSQKANLSQNDVSPKHVGKVKTLFELNNANVNALRKMTSNLKKDMLLSAMKRQDQFNKHSDDIDPISSKTRQNPFTTGANTQSAGYSRAVTHSSQRPQRNVSSLFQQLRQKYPQLADPIPVYEDYDGETQGSSRPDHCTACFNFNFPIVLNHEKLCKSSSGKSTAVRLLILIASAPGNSLQRSTIRQTWGSPCRDPTSQLKCVFVVGLSISEEINSKLHLENDHHQDILQIGFKDSYSNLTYKTISCLKWASRHCYIAKYVMKTDDDMYVNTELIPIMLQAAPMRKFMGGACWGPSSPNRDRTSKWFVSIQSFHRPHFPAMCSGTGYIMSMDVVRAVIFSSHNLPFFHLEDVYVSLCLQMHAILPINILGFSNMFQDVDVCRYKNGVMTSHQVSPEQLEDFWLSMSRCPKSTVSPSQLFIVMPYPQLD